MAKIKIKISLSVSFCFLLCFVAVVFGDGSSSSDSDPSKTSNANSKPSQSPAEYLEDFAKYFKALENRNQELEKSQEEFKDFKVSWEKSQLELKEEVESLKTKVEKLEQGISEDDGVWLLTPPLRGPPGKKGETGNQGLTGAEGDRGKKGEKGDKGDGGQDGTRGEKGEKGEKGPAGSKGDRGIPALESITSCSKALELLPSPRSQKQVIYPHGKGNSTSLEVLCDFETDGGGWTIIQKRTSGPKEEFKRNWAEYEKGFGSLDKNFWLGLENIRALTKNGDQELRIQLEDHEGNKKYAKYSTFSVSDASDFYRLSISGFSPDSTVQDDFHYSGAVLNGMQFTTKDKDNDKRSYENCAVSFGGGGWWFNSCFHANLNGLYFAKGETVPSWQGIHWLSWKGWNYSLAKTEMKIRTRK